MLTIPDYEAIAKEATERIAREFAEFNFKAPPPVVTSGIVRAVLEAVEHRVQLTGYHVAQMHVSTSRRSSHPGMPFVYRQPVTQTGDSNEIKKMDLASQ